MTLVGLSLTMPERTGALYQSKNGVRATGTNEPRQVQSARTTMTSIIVLSVWGAIAAVCVFGGVKKNNH